MSRTFTLEVPPRYRRGETILLDPWLPPEYEMGLDEAGPKRGEDGSVTTQKSKLLETHNATWQQTEGVEAGTLRCRGGALSPHGEA